MIKSRLISEDKVYVKFDHQGNTQLVRSDNIVPGFSYRRVHETQQLLKQSRKFEKGQAFQDHQFTINKNQLQRLDPHNTKIVLRRLKDLVRIFDKNQRPMFFPSKGYIPQHKLSKDPFLPPFATELGVFPTDYYKSFFITQDFSLNGLYQMIINQKGRFELDVVDDWIPVYQDTLEPIWGMDFDQSWQIILLKFWAKRSGGYLNVKNMPPYVFLQYFSNSNWKYFNLTKQGYGFLNFYAGKTDMGKFILKTKNTNEVQRSGLIPNSAGYEMINLVETTQKNNSHLNPKDRHYIATIRSTMNNKWAGKMSVLDHEINSRYFPQQYSMALQRDFMLNQGDLLNLFSSAYIASRRDQKQKNYISDYYIFNVEPNNKRSIYLKFQIHHDGWFDFCIKQLDQNKISPKSNKSKIQIQEFSHNEGLYYDGTRYLKCRYILVKENNASSPSIVEDLDYLPPAYDTYEIQYSHGYNRGEARFLSMVQGTYILKIKPQSVDKMTYFVVNYASNFQVQIKQYFPSKKQTSLILRQAMASLIGVVSSYHLDKDKKHEQICFANTFQEIGYGFIGVRSKKSCPYRILIDVDPQQVRSSGYKIKNQFKRCTQPFSVLVSPGECTSIVLKKIPGASYAWPPKGVQIFKSK